MWILFMEFSNLSIELGQRYKDTSYGRLWKVSFVLKEF